MNGYSYDPYGQHNRRGAQQQQQQLQQLSPQQQQQQQQQQQRQNQQFQNAYAELASAAASANNPCNEVYDPSLATYGTTATYNPLFSRFGHNNVTVINHLNFSPTLLAADAFSNSQYTAPAPAMETMNHAYATTSDPYGLSTTTANEAAPQANLSYHHHSQQHHNQQQQQQQQQNDPLLDFQMDPLFAFMPQGVFSSPDITPPPPAQVSSSSAPSPFPGLAEEQVDDQWLNDITLEVSAISLEPITGKEVVQRVRGCMNDVQNCYIPCVDFLVQCQQDLRKGLTLATQKRRAYGKRYYQDSMTPQQFFSSYVERLPQQFLLKTERLMDSQQLEKAITGLQQLVTDARKSRTQGCEAVKNSFLGGMKDGESWGLRKWLSRNGNALTVCTQLECILNACKKLDHDLDSTKKLAGLLRPLAKSTLDKLRSDIPSSYQEVSAAHPYLPFFHRLESALRGVSTFDPEDDDVICIDDDDDDDEIEVVPSIAAAAPPKKRKRETVEIHLDQEEPPPAKKQAPFAQAPQIQPQDDSSSSGESDDETVVEVVDVQPTFASDTRPWSCNACRSICDPSSSVCSGCGLSKGATMPKLAQPKSVEQFWPVRIKKEKAWAAASVLAENLERLATAMEGNQNLAIPLVGRQHTFWDDYQYVKILRMFVSILRNIQCLDFVNPVNTDALIQAGSKPYAQVIKHPLCLRDIAHALLQNEDEHDDDGDYPPEMNTGKLPSPGLSSWNMWRGADLLQALDLVFLNALAYGKAIGEGKTQFRSKSNKLRKNLWAWITATVVSKAGTDAELKRQLMPTRRTDSSSFVVFKK